jgi:nitrogenase-stabilizing/protective protein
MNLPSASPMERFKRCRTAEEYFELLDVSYDPRVLAVSRLHILRHFAEQVRDLHLHRDATEGVGRVLDSYRDALVRSYQAFTTETALDHRLFKVLQDHAPRDFVPLAAVAVERQEHNR